MAGRGRVLVHDEALQRALAPVAPTTVVRLPVDVDAWPTGAGRAELGALDAGRLGRRPDERVVLAFGSLRRDKGYPTAVAALAHLPPHVKLAVIGAPVHFGEHDRAWARARPASNGDW